MKKIYIGCENAASATAKLVYNYFNRYEWENDLPGETQVIYFGNEEEMLDHYDYYKEHNDYQAYHYEIYIRPTNHNLEPVSSGWVKVEGGYSKGAREMQFRAFVGR